MVQEGTTRPVLDVVVVPATVADDVTGPVTDRLAITLRSLGAPVPGSAPDVPAARPAVDGPAAPAESVGARLARAVAAAPGRPIALVAADVLVSGPALGALLDDPRVRTGVLAAGPEGGPLAHLGAMRVDGPDRPLAARLLRAEPAGDPDDLLLRLARGLTAAGVEVTPVRLGGYAWARPESVAQLRAALAELDAVDERRVRLREAARTGDGFYSTFVLRRLSWRLTGLAERAGLTPNAVTLVSFGLGLAAAALIAAGDGAWPVAGGLLLQLCLVVDCVDGELARYRRRFSPFGAWLDATTDRVKEFAVILATGVAAARAGADPWTLVAAAVGLQTFRNLFDLGWARARGAAVPEPVSWVAPAGRRLRPAGSRPGPGARTWARRLLHFPVGERFLLLSVGACLGTPSGALVALLALGLLAALAMVVAYALRAARPAPGAADPLDLLDAGPLVDRWVRATFGGDRAGRVRPVLPAVLAAAELALLWVLAVPVAGAPGWAGGLLVAAVAVAHYQRAYGVRDGAHPAGPLLSGPPPRLAGLLVGVLVPAAALDGPAAADWARGGTVALAALVTGGAVAGGRHAWTRPAAGAPTRVDPVARPARVGVR